MTLDGSSAYFYLHSNVLSTRQLSKAWLHLLHCFPVALLPASDAWWMVPDSHAKATSLIGARAGAAMPRAVTHLCFQQQGLTSPRGWLQEGSSSFNPEQNASEPPRRRSQPVWLGASCSSFQTCWLPLVSQVCDLALTCCSCREPCRAGYTTGALCTSAAPTRALVKEAQWDFLLVAPALVWELRAPCLKAECILQGRNSGSPSCASLSLATYSEKRGLFSFPLTSWLRNSYLSLWEERTFPSLLLPHSTSLGWSTQTGIETSNCSNWVRP